MKKLRGLLLAVLVFAVCGVALPGSAAARPAQLTVTTQSPLNGQTVSGSITWQVSVSGGTPTRVDLAIDGVVRWSQTTSPYLYGGKSAGLDTTQLSNGAHTLAAIAYGPKGVKSGRSSVTVTVANAPPPPPGGSSRVYWGAQIGDQLTGTQAPWDMNAVSQFEALAGKPLSLVHFASPFANCYSSPCWSYGFPTSLMESVRQHGAIPFFTWGSQSIPVSPSQPDFQLSDVIAGTYDSYIRSFATSAKAWGKPFFLRFNHEMNGDWFLWSERRNGNGPGQYVAAWRHVHDIFTSVGATNATWVWCPYTDPGDGLQSLSSLYPGDAYVDWTCLDGFNWGTNPSAPWGWRSFNFLFNSTYHQIVDTIAPSKPMVIGETASSEYGGSKAGWIHNMFDWLSTDYPKVRGLLWFETYADGVDWPIETSTTATDSFATGIQNPAYAANSFGAIGTSPIPPPG